MEEKDIDNLLIEHFGEIVGIDKVKGLATNIRIGKGFKKDEKMAFEIYSSPRLFNDEDAQLELAEYYLAGIGTEVNYKAAFDIFQRWVSLGSTDAMVELGDMYALGHTEEQNYINAVALYQKATELGSHKAKFRLANSYFRGVGVPCDFNKAFDLYLEVASNYPRAYFTLGQLYLSGIGTTRDSKKAFEAFKAGASLKDADCLGMVGQCYESGIGTDIDLEKAIKFYETASKEGSNYAIFLLARCYEEGIGVTKDLKVANKWYEKSAKTGNPLACYQLGHNLLFGRGIEANPKKAFPLLKTAAMKTNPRAMTDLGFIYSQGFLGTPDYQEALKWYHRGDELDNPECSFFIAKLFIDGKGVEKDLDLAIKYLKKASEQGFSPAMNELAVQYLGMEKNSEAFELLEEGARQKDYQSIYLLASCYTSGVGCERNDFKGLDLYLESANLGYPDAMYTVAKYYLVGTSIVSKDTPKAIYWLKKSCEKEVPDAFWLLGGCYESGYGVEQSYSEAIKCYTAGAKLSSEACKTRLEELRKI